MAEAVVSIVLGKLKDFMIKEVSFLCAVGDRVERAQTELQLLQGYLKDADARQEEDEGIRVWVASVREAAYDFEDVIDTFYVKVIFNRKHRNLLQRFAGIFEEAFHLHMIGSEAKKITTKMSNLKLSLQRYNIKELQGSGGVVTSFDQSQRHQRRVYPHVKEREVVGLDGDAKILADYLVQEQKCHLVVSIWGMGGSGKTTLAKYVYHHNAVRHYFDCFAWVYVSQRCRGKEVQKETLIQLISATNEKRGEIANMNMEDIATILYQLQIKRRCLVVLDDIWNTDAWDILKNGFPTNEETGSRLLLTTRNREVAQHVDRNCLLYPSHLLNANASWELFAKIAIFRTAEPNSETCAKKEELGKRMLQHCAGLPLAIIVLAELLARKKTIEEWDIVHKNVDVYIRRGTNLEREYKGQEYKGTSWVLALSYDNLPYRLKLCFLYLGHFPEDYEIPVKRLTQLWMAEGLISPTSEEMVEDVGYNCLNELVERCMVQVGRYGSTNKIKSCRLHDLMRDLCLLKGKEENFLHIVDFSSNVTKAAPIVRVRRLSVYLHGEVDKLADPRRDGRLGDCHLRSLFCFGDACVNARFIRPMFNDFKLLRVMKFEDMVAGIKLPRTIGNLVHLRFLSLKNTNIEELPASVANLVCLQTLDLRCSSVWNTVPNVFGKMEELRHLYLPSTYKRSEKLLFGDPCSLQTLVNVSWGHCDLAELTNLRKLFIEVPEPSQNSFGLLKSTNITSLSVNSYGTDILGKIVSSCHYMFKLRVVGPIRDVVKDLPNYPNLSKLTVEGTILKTWQIVVLEKLPKLRKLCLTNAFCSRLVFSRGGFLHLEFLSLKWLDELEEWIVEKGAMPSLCRLHIERCSGVTTFPDGLHYVTTLNELTIKDMPPAFCNRLQEGGVDFYKIQHVASVTLDSASHEFNSLKDKIITEKIRIALYVQEAALEFISCGSADSIDQYSQYKEAPERKAIMENSRVDDDHWPCSQWFCLDGLWQLVVANLRSMD